MKRKIIIAIDGYSSCGKSTFAKAIAARLGYIFIDTGAMYRAVTLYTLMYPTESLVEALPEMDIEFHFNANLARSEVYLNGENIDTEIRSIEVSNRVSQISQIMEVRHKLVAIQQKMGLSKGVVMDGRDIGTVVFPDAELKIFMTADPEIRAMRRFLEMDGTVSLEEIERNVRERDFQDENRANSPLRRAQDALILDNSHMTVDQQMDWVMAIIEKLTRQ